MRPEHHSPQLMMLLLLSLTCSADSLNSHTFRHRQHASVTITADTENTPTTTTEETITFSAAPTAPPPVDMIVRLHQEARLLCDLYKDTRPKYTPTWRHSDQTVVDVNTAHALAHRYTQDPLSGELRIANVRLEDGGLWRCEERELETGLIIAHSSGINLIVTEPPKAPYFEVDGRRLDPGNVFLPVTEGAALSVWCVAEGGHPPPKLFWRLYMSNPTPQLNTTNTKVAHQYVRSEARITRVLRAHHNSTITCLVHHVTLPDPLNATLLLDVQYTPSFVITREPGFGFPLVEGIPVSLKCDVDSNPPSNPVWVKDDGPPPVTQSVDGFLNFSAISREHSGWYKCTSREFSSIGYFLSVRYEEEVTVDTGTGEASSTGRQIEVALGGAVQLQCPATGGVSCWSRVGTGGTLEPVGVGPELSLERVLYQEAGTYRCTRRVSPRLEEWRSMVNVDLSVTGAPAVYPSNKTLTAIAGQELTFKVEFCANPPVDRGIWLTDRVLLRPGDSTATLIAHHITAGSSPHCHQAALTVRAVRPTDAGEYVFLVRSPKGLAEGSVMINVTTASGFSVVPDRGQHVTPITVFYIATILCFLVT
ncbi:CD166 antigen homolog [Anabrus simplex]|uniref:CD166 antigen homolog n=1 Tax=Anabrus simplex TaxID=316456 RepID=UPI0035A299E9